MAAWHLFKAGGPYSCACFYYHSFSRVIASWNLPMPHHPGLYLSRYCSADLSNPCAWGVILKFWGSQIGPLLEAIIDNNI